MKPISIQRTNKLNFFRSAHQAGFTLLEVLIAMTIAALMISVATIAFGDNDLAKLKNKSRQFYGLLQIAQEESIIRGVEMGVRVESDGYSFMVYNGGKWQPLQDHRLLRPIKLDEPVHTYVNVEGQESLLQNEPQEEEVTSDKRGQEAEQKKKEPETPQIYMLSSGESNQFVVTIGLDRDEPVFYRITGDYVGNIELSSALEGHYSHDWDKDLEDDE
ncbi:type II secretion system minor pseudopilin GspH [Kangiella sediminilitoris]|uniref:Type II secretion system protein H n=1 Tax=Kangiella sediminilitoris TaxID=1144748 RepID=A0A1B3B892_9GAMM|nr:type II secretion system minor pseudopilin GspH [Kangiella sediminilitoris]AOE49022.1 General secretion pathway protein H [Kangiella sediminilitoris]